MVNFAVKKILTTVWENEIDPVQDSKTSFFSQQETSGFKSCGTNLIVKRWEKIIRANCDYFFFFLVKGVLKEILLY